MTIMVSIINMAEKKEGYTCEDSCSCIYSLRGLDNKQNYGVRHSHDWLLQNSPSPLKFKRYNLALLSSRYIFTFCEAIFGKPWIVGNHRALPGSLRNSEE